MDRGARKHTERDDGMLKQKDKSDIYDEYEMT